MSQDPVPAVTANPAPANSWFKRHAAPYAIVYMLLSIALEIVLMVIFRLKVPQDNRIIAPIILTIPPLLAAWLCGYRRPRQLLTLAFLTTLLTLIITVSVNKLTGIKTGLAEPIVNRLLAGFLAAWLCNKMVAP